MSNINTGSAPLPLEETPYTALALAAIYRGNSAAAGPTADTDIDMHRETDHDEDSNMEDLEDEKESEVDGEENPEEDEGEEGWKDDEETADRASSPSDSRTSSQRALDEEYNEEEDLDEEPEERIKRIYRRPFPGEAPNAFMQHEVERILPQLEKNCTECNKTLDQVAKLPGCEHIFCGVCAVEAVREKRCCPLCGSFALVWQIVLLDMSPPAGEEEEQEEDQE